MMLAKLTKFSLVSFASALTACNTLGVSRLDPDNITPKTTSGLVYPLQFTQYTVTLTRGIANCETVKDGGDPTKDADLFHDVKPFIKAEIKSELVDDGDHVYVINSDSLNGSTKVTSLAVTWKNGKLSSINAFADDKTGEIITSVASGMAKIALASQGGTPAVAVAAPAARNTFACSDEAKAALKNVVRHQGSIRTASSTIEQLTRRIREQETDLAKTGKKPDINCSADANADEIQCKLRASVTALRGQQKSLASAEAGLKSSMTKISYQQTITWPEVSTDASSSIFKIPESYIKRWTTKKTKLHPDSANIPPYQIDEDKFREQFETFFLLKKIGSYGKKSLDSPQADSGPEAGIRYRLPAIGYLVVCKNTIVDAQAACDRYSKDLSVASLVGPVMQYGHIFSVPFESKAFSNANFSLAFDEQGRLTEAKIAQTESPGESAASTFQSLAETYAEIEAAKYAKEEADKPKTELELFQGQAELAKAQKELLDAQSALNPATTPLTELQQKIELAKAEKEYIDAMNALIPEVDEKPSAAEEELAVIQTETALLQAKVAKLQAIIAIQEASKRLAEE